MLNSLSIDAIDLGKVWKAVCKRRKLFYIVLPVTFVVSSLIILSVPRYYTTSMRLAPEMNNQGTSTLGSIASSFGFNIDDFQTGDAINPMLYPDLMDDNGFVSKLFDIHVVSSDGAIDTDYFTYLRKHQKSPWWAKVRSALTSWMKKAEPERKDDGKEFDPYGATKAEDEVMMAIRGNISVGFDKKNGVISVNVTAQDPLICRTVADSMRTHLQQFITDYRTNKARTDLRYFEKMAAEAKADYDEARRAYSTYHDANLNAVMASVSSRLSDLENDMQMKYNTYTLFNTQLQNAKAKVQDRTPAFTMLKGASIPIMPSGPKRMVFVLAMVFIAFLCTSIYVSKDILRTD